MKVGKEGGRNSYSKTREGHRPSPSVSQLTDGVFKDETPSTITTQHIWVAMLAYMGRSSTRRDFFYICLDALSGAMYFSYMFSIFPVVALLHLFPSLL